MHRANEPKHRSILQDVGGQVEARSPVVPCTGGTMPQGRCCSLVCKDLSIKCTLSAQLLEAREERAFSRRPMPLAQPSARSGHRTHRLQATACEQQPKLDGGAHHTRFCIEYATRTTKCRPKSRSTRHVDCHSQVRCGASNSESTMTTICMTIMAASSRNLYASDCKNGSTPCLQKNSCRNTCRLQRIT